MRAMFSQLCHIRSIHGHIYPNHSSVCRRMYQPFFQRGKTPKLFLHWMQARERRHFRNHYCQTPKTIGYSSEKISDIYNHQQKRRWCRPTHEKDQRIHKLSDPPRNRSISSLQASKFGCPLGFIRARSLYRSEQQQRKVVLL